MTIRVLHGDCRDVLKTLPDASVQCVVTSPPYYGLRDYGTAQWEGGDAACAHAVGNARGDIRSGTHNGSSAGFHGGSNIGATRQFAHTCGHCGATRTDSQIGLEASPEAYIAQLVAVFREVRRVLRDDGVVWLNLGDSYASQGGIGQPRHWDGREHNLETQSFRRGPSGEIKPKDLMMIPARVAIALQADGWYLRSQIPWLKRSCLSGGTRVYAKTQKGEMPMTIKDMVRLDPSTVKLWNGEKWTQVVEWWETERPSTTYEIELRNGQRIGCTGEHLWPTKRGDIRTDQLHVSESLFPADVILTCRLPEPEHMKTPAALDDEMVGWFVGLYIAEGSRYGTDLSIASHQKEEERFSKLRDIADAFHGAVSITKTSENGCCASVQGPMLSGIVDTYVSGRIASDKHLGPRCWQRSDVFLRAVLDGYLSGDGHWDEANQRWRLGFCNNDELVADLRTLGARLGIRVRLRRAIHKLGDQEFPGYRGELRFDRRIALSNPSHFNTTEDGEVIAIRESRARQFWDIHVEDSPHVYSLASGVMTHNCMPESTTDRPTNAVEYVYLLTKNARYFWDAEAIKREGALPAGTLGGKASAARSTASGVNSRPQEYKVYSGTRNFRNSDLFFDSLTEPYGAITDADGDILALDVNTAPYAGAHFATFPPKLIEPLIRAGSSERGCCSACGAPWVRTNDRNAMPDSNRPQARRAIEIYENSNLTAEHLNAIKACGVTDIGKATVTQNGAGKNTDEMKRLASEAKEVLGGYYREFLWTKSETVGWSPSCQCNAGAAVPCTILDPFAGAGTTGLVADRLGRNAVLIDLNGTYTETAVGRITDDCPLFVEIA